MTQDKDPDRAVSQTVKALLSLRDLILSGALQPGERISELSMVERTGVSRTPVRMALVRLEEEGLIEAIPSGGFAVKAFSEADIFDSIEVRGAMEGLVARAAAERGASRAALADIKLCLDDIDALTRHPVLNLDHFASYVQLNARFHAALHDMSGSAVMIRQAERASALPFASPSGFVMAQSALPQARTILIVAQDQHRCVIEAIENREGERAESIMREHARLARRNLQLALGNQTTLDLVAGSALIRRPSRA